MMEVEAANIVSYPILFDPTPVTLTLSEECPNETGVDFMAITRLKTRCSMTNKTLSRVRVVDSVKVEENYFSLIFSLNLFPPKSFGKERGV